MAAVPLHQAMAAISAQPSVSRRVLIISETDAYADLTALTQQVVNPLRLHAKPKIQSLQTTAAKLPQAVQGPGLWDTMLIVELLPTPQELKTALQGLKMRMSIDPRVVVQLRPLHGECWEQTIDRYAGSANEAGFIFDQLNNVEINPDKVFDTFLTRGTIGSMRWKLRSTAEHMKRSLRLMQANVDEPAGNNRLLRKETLALKRLEWRLMNKQKGLRVMDGDNEEACVSHWMTMYICGSEHALLARLRPKLFLV